MASAGEGAKSVCAHSGSMAVVRGCTFSCEHKAKQELVQWSCKISFESYGQGTVVGFAPKSITRSFQIRREISVCDIYIYDLVTAPG